MNLRWKHIFITGASSGIGEALARGFSNQTACLTLVSRRKEVLEALAEYLRLQNRGLVVQCIAADLSDPEMAQSALEQAVVGGGPVDLLVNNAGAQLVESFARGSAQAGEQTLRLNLHTPLRLTHAVLPAMLAEKRGVIVDICSMSAFAQTAGMVYYNAGKAGLAAASESLRIELAGTGVRVLTVYPGPVETPMGTASFEKHEMKSGTVPTGTPDGLVRSVQRALDAPGKARVVYPALYWPATWIPMVTRWLSSLVRPAFLK